MPLNYKEQLEDRRSRIEALRQKRKGVSQDSKSSIKLSDAEGENVNGENGENTHYIESLDRDKEVVNVSETAKEALLNDGQRENFEVQQVTSPDVENVTGYSVNESIIDAITQEKNEVAVEEKEEGIEEEEVEEIEKEKEEQEVKSFMDELQSYTIALTKRSHNQDIKADIRILTDRARIKTEQVINELIKEKYERELS